MRASHARVRDARARALPVHMVLMLMSRIPNCALHQYDRDTNHARVEFEFGVRTKRCMRCVDLYIRNRILADDTSKCCSSLDPRTQSALFSTEHNVSVSTLALNARLKLAHALDLN